MSTVNELLAQLESAQFYGSLEIKLEAGPRCLNPQDRKHQAASARPKLSNQSR